MISSTIKTIVIDSGNLLTSETFKRKAILVPSGEVFEGVTEVLRHWNDNSQDEENGTLWVYNKKLQPNLSGEDRSGLKVSVKVFTYTESCKIFTAAITQLMKAIQVDEIDSLTLVPPPSHKDGYIEGLKAVWKCAVSHVLKGKIKDLGVSDLDTEQLKELYDWTAEIKPSTNQVNLDTCCVIPPAMTEFANQNNIRLLTHNDPRDFVPRDKINLLLSENGFSDSDSWKPLWAIRYSVLSSGNGVIKAKGYMVAIVRE